jgi:hypothetical protein
MPRCLQAYRIMEQEAVMFRSGQVSLALSLAFALAALVAVSGNLLLAALAAGCMLAITTIFLGTMQLLGWTLGVLPSHSAGCLPQAANRGAARFRRRSSCGRWCRALALAVRSWARMHAVRSWSLYGHAGCALMGSHAGCALKEARAGCVLIEAHAGCARMAACRRPHANRAVCMQVW